MAIIKSYTDIEQSRKLVEILPLESADAFYIIGKGPVDIVVIYGFVTHKHLKEQIAYKRAVPCWSLAALIKVMPSIEGFKPVIDLDINQIRYEGKYRDELCFNSNNLVDACVAMIEHLNELKML